MLKITDLLIENNEQQILSVPILELNSSERALILGKNNTGKSILLKAINNDYFEYEGEILIHKQQALSFKKRKKTILISLMPQLIYSESLWKNLILPFGILTKWQKKKLMELCELAKVNDLLEEKAKNVAYSTLKMIEIIRAVSQMPYLVLLDDFDSFFDDVNLKTALELLDVTLHAGSAVVVTSKNLIPDFHQNYRIQQSKLVKI